MKDNTKTERTRKSTLLTTTATACLSAVLSVTAVGQTTAEVTEAPVASIFSAYLDVVFDPSLATGITANKTTDMSSSDLFFQAAAKSDIEVRLYLGFHDPNGDLYVAPLDALAIAKQMDRATMPLATVGVWDDTDIVHVVILPDREMQRYTLLVLNTTDLGGQEGEEFLSAQLVPLPLPTGALGTCALVGLPPGIGLTFKASEHVDCPELWSWVEEAVVQGRWDDADIVHVFADEPVAPAAAISSLPVGGDVIIGARR